jgi:GDPmannose 4,6-dehydratase
VAGDDPAASAAPVRALITGVSGQDGSYLAELLLDKGYAVAGLVRDTDSLGLASHLSGRIEVLGGDLLDPASLRAAVELARPSELYHLAAPSFVPASWERPDESVSAITAATATLLSVARDVAPATRVYVAGSGLMFGATADSPQSETTPCLPRTPYAIAKLAAHQLVGAMREQYGLHASSGITFNHESERRPPGFVTRKVTRAAAAISLGLAEEVVLGDLGAVRDWSFAGDIVHGAWLMLQQPQADDYVLASGVPHTVAEFARTAFAVVGLESERYVRVDPALVRPPEPTPSVGDPSKARDRLGWVPEVDFDGLVARMVQADVRALSEHDRTTAGGG